jgi:hypothetical protein
LGGFTVLVGVGLALSGTTSVGAATSIAGAVTSFVCRVFWKLYDGATAELNDVVADLRRIERAHVGVWVASQIADPQRRDRAVEAVVMSIAEIGTD